MADNPVQWGARSAAVHLMTSLQLINLAAATLVAGTEYDNSAGYQYGDIQLYCRARTRSMPGIAFRFGS